LHRVGPLKTRASVPAPAPLAIDLVVRLAGAKDGAGMELGYNRNHGKWFASDVLRTVRRYALIADGDRVAVGLSGGKDSVTLLFILWYLVRHARLECELWALHIRTADGYDSAPLREYCEALAVPFLETALQPRPASPAGSVCAVCARLKRGAAARALAPLGIRTLAYGHHATDLAETLLMNVALHRRLEGLAPKVAAPGALLTLIRPMLSLTEETVAAVHRRLGLPLLAVPCPYAERNVRMTFRAALRTLQQSLRAPDLPRRLLDALEQADRSGGGRLGARTR